MDNTERTSLDRYTQSSYDETVFEEEKIASRITESDTAPRNGQHRKNILRPVYPE